MGHFALDLVLYLGRNRRLWLEARNKIYTFGGPIARKTAGCDVVKF
jgi:hypothetical protein